MTRINDTRSVLFFRHPASNFHHIIYIFILASKIIIAVHLNTNKTEIRVGAAKWSPRSGQKSDHLLLPNVKMTDINTQLPPGCPKFGPWHCVSKFVLNSFYRNRWINNNLLRDYKQTVSYIRDIVCPVNVKRRTIKRLFTKIKC